MSECECECSLKGSCRSDVNEGGKEGGTRKGMKEKGRARKGMSSKEGQGDKRKVLKRKVKVPDNTKRERRRVTEKREGGGCEEARRCERRRRDKRTRKKKAFLSRPQRVGWLQGRTAFVFFVSQSRTNTCKDTHLAPCIGRCSQQEA